MVKYTARYVDADGKKIASDDTYYGMKGDKPVLSYKYVSGYVPEYYNAKKTLVEDDSKNVFTFRYTKEGSGENGTDNGQGSGNANGAGGNNAGTNANAGGNAGGGANANAGTNANGNTATNANRSGSNTPAEMADLDDGDTPLAENPNGNSTVSNMRTYLTVAAVLVLLAIAGFILFGKRRKNK